MPSTRVCSRIALLVASLTAMTGPAHAADFKSYAGIAGGVSFTDFDSAAGTYPSTLSSGAARETHDIGPNGGLFVGYNFARNWALESTAAFLGKFSVTNHASAASLRNDLTVTATTLDVVHNGSYSGRLSPFALYWGFGLAYVRTRSEVSLSGPVELLPGASSSASTHTFSTHILLGLSWKPTDQLEVRLQDNNWNRRIGNGSTGNSFLNLLTVGLAYHF